MKVAMFTILSFYIFTYAAHAKIESYITMNGPTLNKNNIEVMRNINDFFHRKPELINQDPKVTAFVINLMERILRRSEVDIERDGQKDIAQHLQTIKGFEKGGSQQLLKFIVNQIRVGTGSANDIYKEMRNHRYKNKEVLIGTKKSRSSTAGKYINRDDISDAPSPYRGALGSRSGVSPEEDEELFHEFKTIKKVLRWLNPMVYLLLKPVSIDLHYRYDLPKHYSFLLKKRGYNEVLLKNEEHLRKLRKQKREGNRAVEIKDYALKDAEANISWEITIFHNFLMGQTAANIYSDILNELLVPNRKMPLFIKNKVETLSSGSVQVVGNRDLLTSGDITGFINSLTMKELSSINIGDKIDPRKLGEFQGVLKKHLPLLQGAANNIGGALDMVQGVQTLVNNPSPAGIASFAAQSLISFGMRAMEAYAIATRDKPRYTVARENLYYFGKACTVFLNRGEGERENQRSTAAKNIQETHGEMNEKLNSFLPVFHDLARDLAPLSVGEHQNKFKKMIERGACGMYEKVLKSIPKPNNGF